METRAKDLKDFTMWNSTNPSIKFLDLGDASLSQGLFFDCDFAISSPKIQGKGFSKLNNKFAMTLLDDQIGKNLPTDIKKTMSCNRPFIDISFKKMISGFFKGSAARSFKSLLKPVKKTNICVGNLENTSIMAIFIAIIGFIFKFTGMKTSFSVDNACKVGKIKRFVDFCLIKNSMFMVFVVELHIPPSVTSSPTSVHLMCI